MEQNVSVKTSQIYLCTVYFKLKSAQRVINQQLWYNITSQKSTLTSRLLILVLPFSWLLWSTETKLKRPRKPSDNGGVPKHKTEGTKKTQWQWWDTETQNWRDQENPVTMVKYWNTKLKGPRKGSDKDCVLLEVSCQYSGILSAKTPV